MENKGFFLSKHLPPSEPTVFMDILNNIYDGKYFQFVFSGA